MNRLILLLSVIKHVFCREHAPALLLLRRSFFGRCLIFVFLQIFSYIPIVFSHIIFRYIILGNIICRYVFVSGSLSEQQSIRLNGYQLIPEQVSLEAYRMLFRIPEELINAYGVTILVTAVGTGLVASP